MKETQTNHNITKKYLRANDIAEFCSIGKNTVWMYSKQGKLTPIKLSSRVTVFDINEVNKLIKKEA